MREGVRDVGLVRDRLVDVPVRRIPQPQAQCAAASRRLRARDPRQQRAAGDGATGDGQKIASTEVYGGLRVVASAARERRQHVVEDGQGLGDVGIGMRERHVDLVHGLDHAAT